MKKRAKYATIVTAILGVGILCMGIGIADTVYSQDAKPGRGRLSDGRAYRIGADGMQLVDHTAELEVTVEELNRQVQALEDETIVQQRTIDQLTGGKAPNCAAIVQPLQHRVNQLEAQIGQADTVRACDCDSVANPLREQIVRLQNALMSGPSKEEVATQIRTAQGLQQDLSRRDERLASISQELNSTQADLEKTAAQLQAKAAREKELRDQVATLSDQVEDLAARSAASTVKPQAASSTPVAAANIRAAEAGEKGTPQTGDLQVTRKEFNQTLTRIQSLVMKRKDLYDSLKEKDRGVTIQIQPLVTRSGASLDTLRLGVTRIQPTTDVEPIRTGLSELEQKLQEDVGVLGRLTRTGKG